MKIPVFLPTSPRAPFLCKFALCCAGVLSWGAGDAQAELLYATNGTTIARFDTLQLATVTAVPLVGLQAGETLVGIDVRPATSLLFGIGSTSRIYTVNPITGVVTPVGSMGAFTLSGTAFGTDFNPNVDRIRQVSNTEQNLRLNPADGTLSGADTALSPGNIVGVAYTNNFPGATSTTLFGIDSAAGTLVNITVPNSGGPITTVGSLGLGTTLNENIGFDISGGTGIAYASITTSGISRLYQINTATGAATLQGAIGPGTVPYLGLAAATVPEPTSIGLLAIGVVGLLGRRTRRQTA